MLLENLKAGTRGGRRRGAGISIDSSSMQGEEVEWNQERKLVEELVEKDSNRFANAAEERPPVLYPGVHY